MTNQAAFVSLSAVVLAFAVIAGSGCAQPAVPDGEEGGEGCANCSSTQFCLNGACSDRECTDDGDCGPGLVCGAGGACQSPVGENDSRDPWLWPFASDSIWNQPIGTEAVYRPADLEAAGNVGVDTQHLLKLSASDPERAVLMTNDFGPGRCSGTDVLPFTLHVPDNWIVPDAGPDNPYGNTPNSNAAFLLDDGNSLLQLVLVSRCVEGGPVYAPDFYQFEDNRRVESVRGDGTSGGGQGASGMSSMGGNIRLGELTGERPLRHAIKLNPWARKYLYYSEDVPGFRWPATAADSYAADPEFGYAPEAFGRPSAPWLVMGSLLAIPPSASATAAANELRTVPGRILFEALQNYGAYFTEDAAYDTWDLIVERGVPEEVNAGTGTDIENLDGDFGHDLNLLVTLLFVVDDNGPTSIGGAGSPSAPLAPPFAD